MRAHIVLGACGLAVLVAGCAGLMRESTTQLQLVSEPTGALARTSLGQSCTTPCILTVSRENEFVVSFTKEGFQEQTVEVKRRPVPGSSGFLGLTGPEMELAPNPVSATLVALKPTRPARRPKAKAAAQPRAAPAQPRR